MSIRQLDLVLLGNRAITSRIGSVEGTVRRIALAGYGDTNLPSTQIVRPNLLANSSFEYYQRNATVADGWSFHNANVVPATSADGRTAVSMNPGGSVRQAIQGSTVFTKGAFVLSVAARANTASAMTFSVAHPSVVLGAIYRLAQDGTVIQTNQLPSDGQWYRFYIQGLTLGSGSIEAVILAPNTNANAIVIDAAKFEYEPGAEGMIEPTAYQAIDTGAATSLRNLRADNIVAGTLTVGGSSTDSPKISVMDGNDTEIVTIGDSAKTYGIEVKAAAGITVSGSGSIAVTGGGDILVAGGGDILVNDGGKVLIDGGQLNVFGAGLIRAGVLGAQRVDITAGGISGFNATNKEQVRLSSADGKLRVLGPGAVSVEGGGSLIAGTPGAARVELNTGGIYAYNEKNEETVSLSTVDGKLTIDADALVVKGTALFEAITVSGAVTIMQDLTLGSNVLFVDTSGHRVGINRAPDPQFDLDIAGSIRWGGYGVGKMALQLKDATALVHFDGSLKPGDWKGSADTHMGVIPTYHSARYDPGKFNKAALIHEATVNLVPNPSFELDTSYWWSNAASWSRVSGGVFGDYAGRLSYAGSGDGYSGTSINYGASLANRTFTVSVYARTTARGSYGTLGAIILRAGSEDIYYTLTEVTDQWKRYSFTGTFSQNVTTTAVTLYLRPLGRTDVHIEYDGVQVEEKAYETPYCDGSLGNGHSWRGSPHASASARAEGNIQWPSSGIINPKEGTVAFWFKNYYPASTYTSGGWTRLFEYGSWSSDASAQWIAVYYDPQRSSINAGYFNAKGGAYSYGATIPSSFADWHHFAITWKDGEPFRFYIDGVLAGASATNVESFTSLASGSFCLTSNGNARGWYDDLVVLKRAAPSAEIRAIYESDAPVFAETSAWGFRTANTLAWADEEGLWARAANGAEAFGVSGVNGKSWGNIGQYLDAGDVLIGNTLNYLFWDASAGTMRFRGDGAGLTSIHGGNIQTKTITADKITVGSLSAISANIGDITSGTLTSTTITGGTINGGTITGGTINGGTISGTSIISSTIAATTIWAGTYSQVELGSSGLKIHGGASTEENHRAIQFYSNNSLRGKIIYAEGGGTGFICTENDATSQNRGATIQFRARSDYGKVSTISFSAFAGLSSAAEIILQAWQYSGRTIDLIADVVAVQGGGTIQIGTHPAYGAGYGAIWRGSSSSDYAFLFDNKNTFINSRSGTIYFRDNNADRATLTSAGLSLAGNLSASYCSLGNTNTNYWPGTSGWSSGGANLVLNGYDFSSIVFHDAGSRVDAIIGGQGVLRIGANIGWGSPTVNVEGFFQAIASARINGSVGINAPNEVSLALTVNGSNADASRYSIVSRNSNGSNLFYSRNDGYLWAINAWNIGSDERLKEDIQDLPTERSRMKQVRFRKFKRKLNGAKDVGVVAQELREIYPELVTEVHHPLLDAEDKTELAVNYNGLAILQGKALQELDDELEEMQLQTKQRIADLEKRLVALETKLKK